jgi:hypothetical protein
MASTIVVDKLQATGGVVFTLPTADGSAGHLLKTNGSAVLSFTADTDTGILNVVEDTTPQLGGDLDCNGSQIQWSKGADVASATALVLLTDGNFFDVTGTVTITSFNTTGGPGTQIKLQFDAACLLTHHATDLKLPGGANITTAAGDVAEFIEYAAGDYICTSYTRASGKAVVASHSATAGISTIWIPAIAMVSPTTNGAEAAAVETTAVKPELKVLNFDHTTIEYAQFSIAMPKSWDESTVTAKFYWTHATAVATDVIWGIQGVCVSDNDTIDATFGTAVTVTDTFHNAAEDLAITAATGVMTLGGTPAEDDLAYFQVYRAATTAEDTTNSTDAQLIGVKILFTTNAENDA